MASAASKNPVNRKAISLETKLRILDDHRSGVPVKTLVTTYGLSQPTVSTIIRNQEKIRASATSDGASGKRKRMRGAALPDVEDALYKWFVEVRGRNIPVSGNVLTAKAKDLAFLMGHEEFRPGNGWLHRFKERHAIRFKKIVGEAASADITNIEEWMDLNATKIASYDERDVYNADETALFFQLLPSHTHALKNESCAGGKHSKVRVTVLLCCNMDGSDRQKLFVIGKSAKPRDFRNLYSLPVRYRSNAKAWMTKVLFAEWLVELDQQMAAKGRKILLLLDNCSAHRVNPRLTNVDLLFLPPNSTCKTQPLDMGIIANFKVCYKRRVIERILHDIGPNPATSSAPMTKITLSMAVQMMYAAWHEVKQQTVRNCFVKAGIFIPRENMDPLDDNAEAALAQNEIEAAWERLAPIDSVSLEEFLNADGCASTREEVTDASIVEEVRSTELSADESDADDDDHDHPVTVQRAMNAITDLRKFVASRGLDEDFFLSLDKLEKSVSQSGPKLKQATLLSFLK